jgi:SNF2 family DNA or RNA helicase
VAKSISFLLEIGWQVRDWQGRAVHLHTRSEFNAETTNTQEILIKGKMFYDEHETDATNIIGAFNRRERFAQLSPGHAALLPTNLEQIGFDCLGNEGEITANGILISQTRIGALSSFFDNQPRVVLDPSLANLKERLTNFNGIQTTTLSKNFLGILRPYQQKGVDWLAFLHTYGFHGLLADDMGLGKTVQVLAFLSTLDLKAPCLIVVPTSLIFNWKREIERFLPSAMCLVHHGSERTVNTDALTGAQLILTTYSTLRLDISLFKLLTYDCLILDEAQAIKNASTQTFQSVTALNAQFRLSITGTPIENNLNELWAHFRFLIPDLFGEEEAFQAEVQAAASDGRYLKRIKKKIAPFLLRRHKEEVAQDLPDKIEQVIWVEMGEGQRAAYEAFLAGARKRLIDDNGVVHGRMEILEAIMRLRQLCCHPLLATASTARECAESAKLETLLQDIETAVLEKRKVLIYSQFTSMLSLIGKRLREKGWRYVYLDGATQNREKVVSQFQEDPEIPLFLISLKAGGVGLNLTAADYVFLYDPWWNDAAENQAIDRAHRIGRKDTVVAKRYIVAESIEERMMKLKAAKSMLAADLLDEGAMQNNFSTDDLLYLLGS